MKNDLKVAAIVSLVENAQTRRLGKTQLQKLVYFLQAAGVPLGYEYEIYHYGPYSFELSYDMDSLDSLGVLKVDSDPSGFGFDISLGKFSERFKLDSKYKKKLDRVILELGSDNPARLEVKATIHFVKSVLGQCDEDSQSKIVKKVKALKPRFTEEFIKQCYSDLRRASWV
jgi:uncharacterized protein